ncbi:hypothetical protein CAPTEDRAFT_215491 [Capitella teleta]|uniref:Uncharacterized protein n=1 Tax=Capitella teleta TaxID=283909 RepID=R7U634_CAPTE|nr:hypothetical protein CAPTEDRAFT_215491 [Capitella teleta]|eukprot:ELT99156.1 hypothetical protein CAPTEDRAFT_215491 [Capitella teleta]
MLSLARRIRAISQESVIPRGIDDFQKESRFATDQEPVKSRRESERRPTQEMTGDLKRVGRLAIRHSNSHRSNRNKNMERGGVLHRVWIFAPRAQGGHAGALSTFSQERKKDLEEDASFHRPAPVMSEDED